MRRLPSETIARLLEQPAGRFRQQVHIGAYGGVGDAKGFTLGDFVLLRLAHRLRDPGLPLGTAWILAGGFAEPLAVELADSGDHAPFYALVPHGGPDAPCTVPAEDLADAMLDLLESASTVTVVNLTELAEEISVEWSVATGTSDAPRLAAMDPARLSTLIAQAQAKLAAGAVRVTADGALAEREPA